MALNIKRRCESLPPCSLGGDLPPLLQRIYSARQVSHSDDLSNAMSGLLPPDGLKGIDEAVALLVKALAERQHILIVGDFDCDGATSSALAVSALNAMGAAAVDFLVPNRFDYGYGLTPEIVEVAKTRSPDLIITVDNGISSIDGVAAANAAGIPVLVTDHHLPAEQLPQAAAIVNPSQPGCSFASKSLAGVGVVFYLMTALRTALRDCGWFEQQGIAMPNMADYLDLVALGTVADVVPLDRNNRILVEQGLRRMRAGRLRPGIQALLEVAGRSIHRLVSTDLGFTVGPRLNAAGRLDDMSLGIQCLLSEQIESARAMARQMDELNSDRRAIEASMQREALAELDQLELAEADLPWGLCLFNEQWHQGVIGILASRIKDRYHRPVIAFASTDKAGEIKGSARSISGLHIRDALDSVAARHPELLQKFGGHAMAAGMSLQREHLAAFSQAFDEEVRRQLQPDDLEAVFLSDGELATGDFNLPLAQQLRDGGPWGQAFPEPQFDGVFQLINQRIVGSKHLKMVVSPLGNTGQLLDAIAFNVDAATWPNESVQQVQLVYKLDVNEFRGQQSVQLIVSQLAAVSG